MLNFPELNQNYKELNNTHEPYVLRMMYIIQTS